MFFVSYESKGRKYQRFNLIVFIQGSMLPMDFVSPRQSSKVEKARARESNGTITFVLDVHARLTVK